MKSLAIVVPELLPVPPVKGGAVEHWVHEVSQRLNQENFKIAIVSRPSGVSGETGIDYIGIPWTSLERFFSGIKDRVTWKNPLRYLAKIQIVYSYAHRIARAVRDFDVVYLHNEPNILLFLHKRPGQKIVLHMHNDHLSIRLFRPFYRRALAKTDSVICVSDYIRRQAIAHFPEYTDRFCVVFNATDPYVFKAYGDEAVNALKGIVEREPDKQYLLYVGRLAPVKGVHVLIAAFNEIHQRIPKARLIITGSSFFGDAARTAYETELVRLAEPVSHAILFTGYLPHEKLKYLYSLVDIVVVPSVWQDPCPLVVLEAMASGTCLVASKVGGVPEVVNSGINGVLVEPDKVVDLVEEISHLLSDPSVKEKLELVARKEMIDRYSWERLVNDLEQVLSNDRKS